MICRYMPASAGQHLPVLHCTYLCLLLFALSLLSCSIERSEAERGRSSSHCFPVVGASVAKQSEAALNYMLESVRKFVDIVIRAPQHVMNSMRLPFPCSDRFLQRFANSFLAKHGLWV